jgi:lipopolysaccharide biosynthesis regulator YciM
MRAFSGASRALAVMVALSAGSACTYIGQVKAMQSFKAANEAYQQQDYPKAALYEEVLAADPNLNHAYFFLGNSYDNMYRSTRKGEPENDALLGKAVQNYQTAADRLTTSEDPAAKKYGILALQYLTAVFANYIVLSRLYEDAAVYDEAEKVLLRARDVRPDDPNVYLQLAQYYNRQGEFAKTIDALEQRAAREPDNPEAFFTISTYYWDNASRNFRLRPEEKMDNVKKGLTAVDRALGIKADYMEALVYKGLLLRVQANLEKDYPTQQALIKQAEALRDQAEEIRKKRATGA